jgi:hypothetical protein
MKPRKHLTGAAVNHALSLIVAGGFCISSIDAIEAAEKKTYSRVPFAAFSSQMEDVCWDRINMKNRSGICTIL